MGGTWAVPTPDTVSHVIFLNRCSGGCTIHPGNDNNGVSLASVRR
jgi:hypothetical protein